MKQFLLLVFAALFGMSQVVAQADDCPAIVETALQATDSACADTSRNQACYGNVNLDAEFDPAAGDFTFEQQGDIVDVGAIRNLRLSSLSEESGDWGVALMKVQANLPDTLPGQNVTFLLFGDVEIENAAVGGGMVKLPVSATGNINVRSGPSTNDAIAGTLSSGESVTANGRLEDGSWLRVELADGAVGWVFADLVSGEGDLSTLAVVSAGDAPAPDFNPMQAFYFRSGVSDSPCAEAPNSGILIQTPEGAGEVTFKVNEVTITLGSTSFLQAQAPGVLTIHMVENKATIESFDVSRTVFAGSKVEVPLDANRIASGPPGDVQPFNDIELRSLPLGNLERDITLPPALTPDEIAAKSILSQQAFTDPQDDTVACGTTTVSNDPEVDIRSVVVTQTNSSLKVEVRMQEPLMTDYSFAVMLFLQTGENSYRPYLWEVHNGVFRIGELNPQTGQPLANGATPAAINIDRLTGIVSFDINGETLTDDDIIGIGVRSYHTPTEDTQPQPTFCDMAGLFPVTLPPFVG
jgi:hypothetical protein